MIGNSNTLFLSHLLAPLSSTPINMQVIAVLLVCLAAANAFVMPAPYLVRTPAHDSAIIKSDRLGGNFAYSTVEGHAYAAVSPVVQRFLTPVGYSQHAIATPYFGYPYAAQYVAPAEAAKTAETAKALPLAYPYGAGYPYTGYPYTGYPLVAA